MIKTIAVDDEWYNLEEVCELIRQTGFMCVSGRYQNPLDALGELEKIQPQVAFIDIELPEMDGITLAEKLLEKNPSILIVFVTSWNQYAVQAFDMNAIDYIMKPIRKERFNRMAEKIRRTVQTVMQPVQRRLKIRCFGCLEVSIGGTPVRWGRAKAEELFVYLLIHHGSYVHKEKIIETLWPDYEPKRALPVLQTTVCKIRGLFSEMKKDVALCYSGNRYCLSIQNAQCDYFDVERALADYSADRPDSYLAIEKACTLYEKGLLSQQGYLWSMETDQELRKNLTTALREIALQQGKQPDWVKMVKILKQLTALTPDDDEANYWLLKTYEKIGDLQSARSHYSWLEKMMREEYDSKPSARIRELMVQDKSLV